MKEEIDLEQLKKIEIDLLVAVDKICQQQNLRYSLGGGTLLGAVRHNGFIPWDDDIDIMMPRPDYDAFISYCLSHNVPFSIKSWETDKTYVNLAAQIFNYDTVLEDDNTPAETTKIGVYIDIFPIDGLGDNHKEAVKLFKSTRFKRELLVAAQWKKFLKSKTHPWYYEPVRFAFFLIGRLVNKQKIFKSILDVYTKIDFNSSKFAGAVGGSYCEKEILPQKVFTEYIELPFENYKFKAIASYDTYLSSIYGDYMKLPPEEKRVSHHTFKAYFKEQEDK